ncbi:MAG: hypothetical protein M3R62_12125, partial [Acidobacteriota bacterium]|nr:hypothetical protein [Acidobacteriota bacterium]
PQGDPQLEAEYPDESQEEQVLGIDNDGTGSDSILDDEVVENLVERNEKEERQEEETERSPQELRKETSGALCVPDWDRCGVTHSFDAFQWGVAGCPEVSRVNVPLHRIPHPA